MPQVSAGCTLSRSCPTSTSNTRFSGRCQVVNHSSGWPSWSSPCPSSISSGLPGATSSACASAASAATARMRLRPRPGRRPKRCASTRCSEASCRWSAANPAMAARGSQVRT
ncbi:Uncharacterised protein [Bordetella pertussis]|nr:Uncharacterised protein [Bordetella pertussis]